MLKLKAYLQALINAILGKAVTPYQSGDVIVYEPDFQAIGRITGGSLSLMFAFGIDKPAYGTDVDVVITRLVITARGDKGYFVENEDVASLVQGAYAGPFGITVSVLFPNAQNVTNNTPISVQVTSISLSFT